MMFFPTITTPRNRWQIAADFYERASQAFAAGNFAECNRLSELARRTNGQNWLTEIANAKNPR